MLSSLKLLERAQGQVKKFSFIFFSPLTLPRRHKKKKAIHYLEKARATFPKCLGAEGKCAGAAIIQAVTEDLFTRV